MDGIHSLNQTYKVTLWVVEMIVVWNTFLVLLFAPLKCPTCISGTLSLLDASPPLCDKDLSSADDALAHYQE